MWLFPAVYIECIPFFCINFCHCWLDTIGALARYISPDVIKPVATDCMELGIVSICCWCQNLSENGDVSLEGGGVGQEQRARGQK